MTVLVLGGNGFIGNNLIKAFREQRPKDRIISFDRAIPEKLLDGVEYVEGDFYGEESLEEIIEDVDLIFHGICMLNPGNSNEKYLEGYKNDFYQSIKLCEIIKNKNIKMIFLSSGGTVYGRQEIMPINEERLPLPINHYGNLKLAIENTLRVFNAQNQARYLIARIANPYGPGQDYRRGVGFIDAAIKRALDGDIIEVWGKGDIVRDYIHIYDVCSALVFLGTHDVPYDTINISSGKGVSQNQVIDLIRRHEPGLRVEYQAERPVDAHTIVLDNTRLKSIYNHELIGIEKGIESYYRLLKSICDEDR